MVGVVDLLGWLPYHCDEVELIETQFDWGNNTRFFWVYQRVQCDFSHRRRQVFITYEIVAAYLNWS